MKRFSAILGLGLALALVPQAMAQGKGKGSGGFGGKSAMQGAGMGSGCQKSGTSGLGPSSFGSQSTFKSSASSSTGQFSNYRAVPSQSSGTALAMQDAFARQNALNQLQAYQQSIIDKASYRQQYTNYVTKLARQQSVSTLLQAAQSNPSSLVRQISRDELERRTANVDPESYFTSSR